MALERIYRDQRREGEFVTGHAYESMGLGTQASVALAEAADVFAAEGLAFAAGEIAATEAVDVHAAEGYSTTIGTLACAEAADVLAATVGMGISATLAIAETADVLAAVGAPTVGATIASVEAVDVCSLINADGYVFFEKYTDQRQAGGCTFDVQRSGTTIVTGTVAATEAVDVMASAVCSMWGDIAATATIDVIDITGEFNLNASFVIFETDDVHAATATTGATAGTIAFTEAADVASIAGDALVGGVQGRIEYVELADTISMVGSAIVIAATEAPDVHAATGVATVGASMAIVENVDVWNFRGPVIDVWEREYGTTAEWDEDTVAFPSWTNVMPPTSPGFRWTDATHSTPDADPLQPGVITLGQGIRPTVAGIGAWPLYGNQGWSALPTEVFGMYAHNYANEGRILAGGGTKLYELSLTGTGTFTVTDVSKGGGSYAQPTYTGTQNAESEPRYWAWTSFGVHCIAGSKFNAPLQIQSTKGGAFVDIAGSPGASCLTTFKNFVIAANVTNYGAITGTSDMVAWSAKGNYADWVPSPATEAGYQPLLDVPGRIVAIKPLGDAVAIYKQNAIWLMRYVGPPSIFSFQLVVNGQGVLASYNRPAPVVDLGRAHLVVGRDDVSIFDGTTLRSVADGVIRDRLRANPSGVEGQTLGRYRATYITHDLRSNDVIFWNWQIGQYLEAAKPAPDQLHGAATYNYRLNKWGIHDSSTTYSMNTDGFHVTTEASTVMLGGGDPGLIYDPGMICIGDGRIPTSCYTSHTGIITGYSDIKIAPLLGNAVVATTLQRVLPQFKVPTYGSFVALNYFRTVTPGAEITYDEDGVWDSVNYRFDIVKNAYWHWPVLVFDNEYANPVKCCEIRDIEYVFAPSGKRAENAARLGV